MCIKKIYFKLPVVLQAKSRWNERQIHCFSKLLGDLSVNVELPLAWIWISSSQSKPCLQVIGSLKLQLPSTDVSSNWLPARTWESAVLSNIGATLSRLIFFWQPSCRARDWKQQKIIRFNCTGRGTKINTYPHYRDDIWICLTLWPA